MKPNFAAGRSILVVVLAAVALLGVPAGPATLGADAGIAQATVSAARAANSPQYTMDQFLATTTWLRLLSLRSADNRDGVAVAEASSEEESR
jgi:hypothetical protein